MRVNVCMYACVHVCVCMCVSDAALMSTFLLLSLSPFLQIVIARGKKRHIYDFNVELDVEVVVEGLQGTGGGEGGGVDDKKGKKFKGKLLVPEVTPAEAGSDATIEATVTWSTSKPPPSALLKTVNAVAEALKTDLRKKFWQFECEVKGW